MNREKSAATTVCFVAIIALVGAGMGAAEGVMVQASIVLTLAAAVAVMLRLPQTPRKGASVRDRVTFLRREPVLTVLLFAMAAGLGVQISVTGTLTTFLMNYRGFDQVTSKIALLLFSAGVASGRIASGVFISPRRYYRTLLALFSFTAVANVLLFYVATGPGLA